MAANKELLIAAGAIDRQSPVPAFRQIYAFIRDRILENSIRSGVRLPSSRRLAVDLGVSRNTVTAAYELLEVEGFIEMAVGRGSFVRDIPLPGGASARRAKNVPNASTCRMAGDPDVIRQARPLALGLPAVDAFPLDVWKRTAARAVRKLAPDSLEYGDPMGLPQLRREIAEYLSTFRAARCSPEQVMVLGSAQMAIYLTVATLLQPGDRAWIEDPGYLGAREAMAANGIEPVPVPVDSQGLQVDAGVRLGADARLAYVTPSHQFPLGPVMSVQRRLALLAWAAETGAWILEDDYDSEFRYSGRPISSLQGLDAEGSRGLRRHFHENTVSFAARRLCRLADRTRTTVCCRANSARRAPVHTGSTHRCGIHAGRSFFGAPEETCGTCTRPSSRTWSRRAARLCPTIDLAPDQAGMHLVGRLPEEISDVEVERIARSQSLDIPALSKYYAGTSTQNGLLLGYTGCTTKQIDATLARLADIIARLER